MNREQAEQIAANLFSDLEYLTRENGQPIPEATIKVREDTTVVKVKEDKDVFKFNVPTRKVRRSAKQKVMDEIKEIIENPSLYMQQVDALPTGNPTKDVVDSVTPTQSSGKLEKLKSRVINQG
jgi:fructose-1-phosphate kinase PfkB-like protein